MHSPHRGQRRRRAVAGLAALGALTFAAPAVAAPFPTACQNTFNSNYSQIDVTEMSAMAPASVPPNANFGVTAITGVVKVPSAIAIAGYNAGLVKNGDQVDGTLQMVIEGTNTTQITQTTPVFNFKITVAVNDPDMIPGSGDETSEPVSVPFTLADQTWTSGPNEGAMAFRVVKVEKTLSQKDKGGMLITVSVPTGGPQPLVVKFGCNPGTVEGSEPGKPTYSDFAAPYATSTIANAAPPPPPPPGEPPPPSNPNPGPGTGGGYYPIPNTFTFGKLKLNRKKGTAKLPVRVPGAGVLRLRKGKTVGRVKRPSKAGRVNFIIKARGKAKRKLNRTGKLKVRLIVSFTPTGGTKLTKTKKITLKKHVKRNRKRKK